MGGGCNGKIKGVAAIDGKTVRRSMDGSSGKCAIHVVSAWAVESGIVLGQLMQWGRRPK